MLLRSSSTPILGSLLSSFSAESPNSNYYHETNKHHLATSNIHNKNLFHPTGSLNFNSGSCNSSPVSPSIVKWTNLDQHSPLRRAQSEGNLEGLDYFGSCSHKEEHIYDTCQARKLSGRLKCKMLETIPSFSFCNLRNEYEDDEEERDVEEDAEKEELERLIAMEGRKLSLENQNMNLVFAEEVRVTDATWNVGFGEDIELVEQEMYLAKGLGISGGGGGGGGGGGEFNPAGCGGDGWNKHEVEEHYKRMMEENPGNPLFMRNYAQFLYKSKQDLHRAEEYYSRAILADPKDGEILSQYANLVWELHRDHERASSYFERAVQASAEDSHVHAAYANFLWETEEHEDEENGSQDLDTLQPIFHKGAIASASATVA